MMKTLLLFALTVILTASKVFAQSDFYDRLADSAFVLTKQNVRYDPKYMQIPYPNGDVPSNIGVCTDLVVRAYRKFGIDLQKEVHVDMVSNFSLYPNYWGLSKPDSNIDHRRVPNLMVFFERFGTVKKNTENPNDYKPGDIVCWRLNSWSTHIGIVSNSKSADGLRYMMIHNIGDGQVLEDCLFSWTIIGHYQYGKK